MISDFRGTIPQRVTKLFFIFLCVSEIVALLVLVPLYYGSTVVAVLLPIWNSFKIPSAIVLGIVLGFKVLVCLVSYEYAKEIFSKGSKSDGKLKKILAIFKWLVITFLIIPMLLVCLPFRLAFDKIKDVYKSRNK